MPCAAILAGAARAQRCLRRRQHQERLRSVAMAAADEASKLVMCFDFDGVVCDSVDESTTAAWRHAKERWPRAALGSSAEPFLQPMRIVRPVVETGWENTVIIRTLADVDLVEAAQRAATRPKKRMQSGLEASALGGMPGDFGPRGPATDLLSNLGTAGLMCKSILGSWETMRDQKVEELGLDVQELIREFGEVRDRWMSDDLASWLACNKAYDMVPDVMMEMVGRGSEVYIITTKQKRFAQALLEDFGIELPADHIFALEDGPKPAVLKSLLGRPEYVDKEFHFIEDKLGTLRKVAKDPELASVKLHLASWGYCTEKDVDIVAADLIEGVSLLRQKDLESLGVSEPWIY